MNVNKVGVAKTSSRKRESSEVLKNILSTKNGVDFIRTEVQTSLLRRRGWKGYSLDIWKLDDAESAFVQVICANEMSWSQTISM